MPLAPPVTIATAPSRFTAFSFDAVASSGSASAVGRAAASATLTSRRVD
jgi:hypothetical protein